MWELFINHVVKYCLKTFFLLMYLHFGFFQNLAVFCCLVQHFKTCSSINLLSRSQCMMLDFMFLKFAKTIQQLLNCTGIKIIISRLWAQTRWIPCILTFTVRWLPQNCSKIQPRVFRRYQLFGEKLLDKKYSSLHNSK